MKTINRAKLENIVRLMNEFYASTTKSGCNSELYLFAAKTAAEELFGGDELKAFPFLDIIHGVHYLCGEDEADKVASIMELLGWEVTA